LHGSAFVYHVGKVIEQADSLLNTGVLDKVFYAMKANWHPALLQALTNRGVNVECVSRAEIEHVRRAVPGLSANRILFSPNFAPRTEYEFALDAGVHLTLDNLHPIQQWPQLWHKRNVMLRVDLGRGRGHHAKVKTGGDKSKFGLSLDQLSTFKTMADDVGLQVVGLHAHLGSGILDTAHWREVYTELASLAEQFPRVCILNIGGGLGVPTMAGDSPLSTTELGGLLRMIKAQYPHLQLWMEPGRYLVAEAGVLVSRVTQTKRKNDVHYVGLETGMNSLIRPALYDAFHPIHNLTRLHEPAEITAEVVGPICETGDILGHHRKLPLSFEDDVFLLELAGAYARAMSSSYNLREPAIEIILEDQ
jgi:bifunctional diaminopimelate decarboxylase / aspartate kinase